MRGKSKFLIVAIFISFILGLAVIISPVVANGDYLHPTDSEFTNLSITVRAKGMGEAFVAVADDYGGSYFNPAGLVQMKQRQIGTMYSDLYGLGLLTHSFLCFAEPATGKGAGEISWNHLSANLEPEKWNYDLFCYSYGQFLSGEKMISEETFSAWGVNLKYLKQTTELEDATGYGLDVSFLRRERKLSWGVNLQNVFSQIDWETSKGESIPLNIKIGTAYRFNPRFLLALDINASPEDLPREVCLGGEWWLSDRIALRLGAVKVFQKNAEFSYSGGLGVYLPLQSEIKVIKRVGLDYAFSYNEALDNTHSFSLSFDF